MTYSVKRVYSLFFDKVEEDADFFAYYGLDDDEAMRLARERARSYLRGAMSYFARQVELGFDLSIQMDEDDVESFAEEITPVEAEILAEIMLLQYFERGLAKLKPKINVLSSSDLKVLHSPANERSSYIELVERVRENVISMLSHYAATDRLTGKRKIVSYAIPSDLEE